MLVGYNLVNNNLQFTAKKKATKSKEIDQKVTYRNNELPWPKGYTAVGYYMSFPSESDESNPIVSSTFRDEELFDEEIDEMDSGYSHYDDNDIIPERQYTELKPLSYYGNDEKNAYADSSSIHTSRFSTGGTVKQIYNNGFNDFLNKNYSSSILKENAIKACTISSKKSSREVSPILTREFENRASDFSVGEIAAVFNPSKLGNGRGEQVVNNDMIMAGFQLLEKYPLAEPSTISSLLNSSVKVLPNGKEEFSKERLKNQINIYQENMKK